MVFKLFMPPLHVIFVLLALRMTLSGLFTVC